MTPWVTRLIIANVAMFIISAAAPNVTSTFTLVPAFVLSQPWTLVTYMFLHGGLMHLLFNMLGLFFFGPRLEDRLGSKDFLWLYFISGLMGAVLSFVFTPYAAIIGASGAVFGVFLGFAYFWPQEKIYVWGIVPIEARWLVVIMTALSLFGGFGASMGGVAHFAHLGGFAGGFLYLKWLGGKSRVAQLQSKAGAIVSRDSDLKRWEKIRREDLHEVNRGELDRIRDKIKATGVTSLTLDDRMFLDRFSQNT